MKKKIDYSKCDKLSEELIEELQRLDVFNSEDKVYSYQNDEGVILLVKIAVH
jgi:hypothetical protein